MALLDKFTGPAPEEITAARRDIHRELVIRAGGIWTLPATPDAAQTRAVAELQADGLVTVDGRRVTLRHGNTDHDIDALTVARVLLLILESRATRGVHSITESAHDLLGTAFDAAEIDAGLHYLRTWRLAKLVNGELRDNTSPNLRARKSEGAGTSIIREKRDAENARVRADYATLMAKEGIWFEHPSDHRWEPDALRAIRQATSTALSVLRGDMRLNVGGFHDTLRALSSDYAEEVFERLTAAGFIRVEGTDVVTHHALPELAKAAPAPAPAPAPATPPKPAPAAPAPADVGDLDAPKAAPAPVTVAPPAPAVPVQQTPPAPAVPVQQTPPAPSSPPKAPAAPAPKAPAAPAINSPALEKKVDNLTNSVERVERKLDTLPPPPSAEKVLMDEADDAVKSLLESVCVRLKVDGALTEGAIHRALPGRSKPSRVNPNPVDKRLRLGEALALGVDARILDFDHVTRKYRLITVTNLMPKTDLERRVKRIKDMREAA